MVTESTVRAAQAGDAVAREKLVASVIKMAKVLARSYAHKYGGFDEALSVALMSLAKSIDAYDIGRGKARFESYAIQGMKYAMLEHLRHHGPTTRDKKVRHPETVALFDLPYEGALLRDPRQVDDALCADSLLAELKQGLPEREVFVLECLIAERTLRDIAKDLRVSESRAYQLRQRLKTRAMAVMAA